MTDQSKSTPNRAWFIAVIVLLVAWSTIWTGFGSGLSLLVIPGLLLATVVCVRSRTWFPLVPLLALNPISWYFCHGIVDYQKGSPTLGFRGLPSFEAFNLDRSTRAFWSGGGCVVYGNEWIYQGMHNKGVRFMSKTFGPPNNTYAGDYPSKEEALEIVADAPLTPLAEFLKGKLRTNKGEKSLDPLMVVKIVDGFEIRAPGTDPPLEIRSAIVENECLLVRLTTEIADPSLRGASFKDLIVLFDQSNGRPFAYYGIGTGWDPHFPPVFYESQ